MSFQRLVLFAMPSVLACAAVVDGAAVPRVAELVKLRPADSGAGDLFGSALDVDGDYAVIGSCQAGLGDGSPWPGKAYIYSFEGQTWSEEALLTASDGADHDRFGWAVGISGDHAAIGAPFHDQPHPGAGAVYMFQRVNGDWVQMAKLSGDSFAHSFGRSIAMDGDTMLIGASGDVEAGPGAGAAYVFQWNGSAWTQQTKLIASDAQPEDLFGFSVAIVGNLAVVGAAQDFSDPPRPGAVYVFQFDGVNWVQSAKLVAPDGQPGDRFMVVGTDGNRIAVGACHRNEAGFQAGVVYVFIRAGSDWTLEAKLLPVDSGTAPRAYFGHDVKIQGDLLLIGSPENSVGNGSAYVFRRCGDVWGREARLVASDPFVDNISGSEFGDDLAIRPNGFVLVGAAHNSDEPLGAGGVYVYDITGDCNANTQADTCEILADPSLDVRGDGRLDQCQLYGDVNHDKAVNVFDVFQVLAAIEGEFYPLLLEDVDIHPCEGNNTVNLFDVFAVLGGIAGIDPCYSP